MYKDIDPEEARELMEQPETIIIDVRTPQEWEEGIIPGALKMNIMDQDFAQRISEMDKDKKYLMVCRSGNRSAKACQYMSSIGFSHLYNLDGGMLDWDGEVEE
ncbi:rhodanese-like domain-containing protein [Marinigracilibium pacificum]|uniref:Rhodanese-like domain-containing protein n=1 Tax=Marinigracilibium pacificum TaxID=2729599 RepID=A0A848J0D8_9BACT|nr:rhodanese-like domain-containing protein [Marinigracilibium pacificum]NMM48985.1 rhodanese-like domain-containing protein [Marinigracilibium pacificum]